MRLRWTVQAVIELEIAGPAGDNTIRMTGTGDTAEEAHADLVRRVADLSTAADAGVTALAFDPNMNAEIVRRDA